MPLGRGVWQLTSRSNLGDLPTGPDNIVWRAVALLRQRAGVVAGADLSLVEAHPFSRRTWAAHRPTPPRPWWPLQRAWRLDWPRERLAEVAAEIGSDVPFFLGGSAAIGSAAICRGRGERIEPIPACRLHLVIVRPPVGLSTPAVYSPASRPASPRSCQPLQASLAGGKVAAAARMLNNRLEEAAEKH